VRKFIGSKQAEEKPGVKTRDGSGFPLSRNALPAKMELMENSARILILVFDGVEEIEAVTPVDILRRAGAGVCMAAVGAGVEVTGRSGIRFAADRLLSGVVVEDFDVLVIPGGPGVAALRKEGRAAELAKEFAARGRWVAAICAAPLVLADAGLLAGRPHTAHSSTHAELGTPRPCERIVRDGKILTSRGAGTAMAFSLELVRILFGEEKASSIARSIMV
jgi:protein deglycase